ncbi:MAG: polysaccharide pyruvyl transferase family protein [Clostridiales bacterium]|nr:polysaccharide pyruvyl transferase family protein [Clostridiales bacterium]
MKYGLLLNKGNVNIGDDIQAFAAAQFLPSFDYLVEREHIDDFVSDDGEPVGVIMNAWYMWAKWNWPPSKYIHPCFVGFHYADHQLSKQPGSPFKYEFLHGIGGQYLKDYGPIGCRDYYTLEQLQKLGIPSYFSGCITLTLPKMPERKNKGSYICLVGLDAKVEKRIKKMLAGKDIEIKVVSHTRERDVDMPWSEREKIVKDHLTLYQNARCVVTKKLHCSLPCLAMEVPVCLIKQMDDDIRFSPYYEYLHHIRTSDFMAGNYEYDFLNPPANKDNYKECREKLIQTIQTFVEQTKDINPTVEELDRRTYSPQELLLWRHDTMKVSMDQWLVKYREIQKKYAALQKEDKQNKALIEKLKSSTQENEKIYQEAEQLKKEPEPELDLQKAGRKLKQVVNKIKRKF